MNKDSAFEQFQRGKIGPLYNQYYPRLVWLAVKKVSKQDAEEIVDDAFVKLNRIGPSRFEDERHVYTWLIVVTRNLCVDLFRTGRRRPRTLPLVDMEYKLHEEDLVELELIYQLIEKNIDLLEPRCKAVVQSIMGNMSTAKIAKQMHLKKRAINYEKNKAIRFLKAMVSQLLTLISL